MPPVTRCASRARGGSFQCKLSVNASPRNTADAHLPRRKDLRHTPVPPGFFKLLACRHGRPPRKGSAFRTRECFPKAKAESSMQVLLTTDVELWTRNWDLSPAALNRAYRQYILGETRHGAVGLPFQLAQLNEHGLRGVFFVEPLFASLMGPDALAEIVGMIRDAGQEVQLHLHTEWMGRAGDPALPGPPRMSVRELSEDAQADVIALGLEWLRQAGADTVCAFRAGAFGADRTTLRALTRVGITLDSSHNPAGSRGPLAPDLPDTPFELEGVLEIPQTVYRDAAGRVRQAQVGSSSTGELAMALRRAQEANRATFVILSHSAELLTGDRERRDRIAAHRFLWLCRFLADHQAALPTGGFRDLDRVGLRGETPGAALRVGPWRTAGRYAEQAFRRLL